VQLVKPHTAHVSPGDALRQQSSTTVVPLQRTLALITLPGSEFLVVRFLVIFIIVEHRKYCVDAWILQQACDVHAALRTEIQQWIDEQLLTSGTTADRDIRDTAKG
jgi:hypothetical protein